MKIHRLSLLFFAFVLLLGFSGCESPELTGSEFASLIMQTVVDQGYVEENGKATPAGLTISMSWIDLDFSDGQATARFEVVFTEFPLESSVIEGSLQADVTITAADNGLDTLTAVFNSVDGPLVVTGKHAATYEFEEATVLFDFDTRAYSFSGVVFIDGSAHTL